MNAAVTVVNGFHRIGIRSDPRDFLFDQMKIAERFIELFPRVCVLDRQFQTRLGCAGAARAESCGGRNRALSVRL